MKAFIGRSFDEEDDKIATQVCEFVDSTGIECVTAKKSQSESIAAQVKRLILECDIFVGLFTCDKEGRLRRIKILEKQKQYTTSNWVIQESGFAIAHSKDLIFLVERGIYKFPKLQGDMEVVYFERGTIERQFTRLSQMIDSIRKRKTKAVVSEPAARPQEAEAGGPDAGEGEDRREFRETKKELFGKLYDALYERKNYTEAQDIFNRDVEPQLDPDEKNLWRALVLRESHKIGDREAFGKLLKLAKDNSNRPNVVRQLALRYKEMGEYEKAKQQFVLATEQCASGDAGQAEIMVRCSEEAAWCYTLDNDYRSGLNMLSDLLSVDDLKDYRDTILTTMARIAKHAEDIERFLIYGEAALEINPSNIDLRFDLAYSYSDNGHNKLGLWHYKKLTDTIEHPAGENNLGVQYEKVGLKAKASESYHKGAAHQETIAMANLAYKYLDQGFTQDAGELIDRAYKLSTNDVDVHPNVGRAKGALQSLLEKERKEGGILLLQAEKERKFRVRYAEAFCSREVVQKNQIEDTWKIPWGEGTLVFSQETDKFEILAKFRKEDTGLALAALTGGQQEPNKLFKERQVSIRGQIHGRSGRYSVQIEDTSGGLLSSSKRVYEADGYMVISEDHGSIDVMEKTADDRATYKTWKKASRTQPPLLSSDG